MSAPVKEPESADAILERTIGTAVPVTEPHWYMTIYGPRCLHCGHSNGESRMRIAGEKPADPKLTFVYEEDDYVCGCQF